MLQRLYNAAGEMVFELVRHSVYVELEEFAVIHAVAVEIYEYLRLVVTKWYTWHAEDTNWQRF